MAKITMFKLFHAKHQIHEKMKSVGFIALSGCLKNTLFHIVSHFLSRNVGFKPLSGFSV